MSIEIAEDLRYNELYFFGRPSRGGKERGMELLEQRIRKDGKIYAGDVLKVDSFLNHQMDVDFLSALGKEFYTLFADCGVNKILTMEASGIGIACMTAQFFHCPVVYAKKGRSSNMAADVWRSQVHSYTHGSDHDVVVSRQYLGENDCVLLIDDFLARGSAAMALLNICRQAGAKVVGFGVCVEKAYQDGEKLLREAGVRVEALAKISRMTEDGTIEFEH